jgi:hypothetical protein
LATLIKAMTRKKRAAQIIKLEEKPEALLISAM